MGFQPLVFPRIQQFLGSKPPIFGVEGFTDLTLQVTLLQSTTGGVDWRDAFDALAPTGVVLQVGGRPWLGIPPKRGKDGKDGGNVFWGGLLDLLVCIQEF